MAFSTEAMGFALTLLKRHEGYRQFPYEDTRKVLTIGHGRNLKDKGISPVEADFMLERDITEAMSRLASLTFFPGLSVRRQAALIDLTVNLGYGGVLQFKRMLARLDAGDWLGAAAELRGSLAESQEPERIADLAGLIIAG